MIHLLHLIRPAHYIKNVLVLFPMFFSGNLLNPQLLLHNIAAFLSFCLMAGAVYIFNDMSDYTSDRLHPEKSHRPLASETVSIRSARLLFAFMAAAGVLVSYAVSELLSGILLTYLLLNIFYSRSLKRYTVPALLIVSAGYILRVLAGAEASGVAPSAWMIILAFFLSLLIGFNKKEMDSPEPNPGKTSRLNMQNVLTLSLSFVILITYIAWSVNSGVQERLGSEHLWISSIFVFAALARYAYLILVKGKRTNPVYLFLYDAMLVGSCTGWSITLFILLYL